MHFVLPGFFFPPFFLPINRQMSFHPADSWTVFSEVLPLTCQECTTETWLHSRVRKMDQGDSLQTLPLKRRLLENDHTVDLDQASEGETLSRHDCEQENWILARQWDEPLVSWSTLRYPCGHQMSALPPVEIRFHQGSIMAVVGECILAVRQDDDSDLSWASSSSRSVPSTVFSAVCAAKDTGHVAVNGVLQLDNESSYLEIRISVFIHRGLLSKGLTCGRAMDSRMQSIIHFVFPPPREGNCELTDNAIKDLYAHLNPTADANPPMGVQHKDLLPKLLPFQQRSVAWCLKRECGVLDVLGNVIYREPTTGEKLPLPWEVVTTASGNDLFVNRLWGLVCMGDETLVAAEPEPRGGILAEEMGLGKTVEVLALILLNRRKTAVPLGGLENQLLGTHLRDDPNVEVGGIPTPLIWSGATLIITPPSIVHQWVGEIEQHAPTLRVFVYVDDSHTTVEATALAQHDVVLTTYAMLAKELDYAVQYDRPRRHRQKYKPRKSAFVQIDWWRVCLDEVC